MSDEQAPEMKWIDATTLCVEGIGYEDRAHRFDRLPGRAKDSVREVIWDLSRTSTGITVRFTSNATDIRARWRLVTPTLWAPHTPLYAFSGIDLYAKTPPGQWHWTGLTRDISDQNAESTFAIWGPFDGKSHEFKAYLPLYNGVESLEIGVPSDARISTVESRPERPICYYGTSIVHGAGASRPGMSQAAMLGRRLDYPLLNLGFSGNAIMEPEVAELLAELDPAVYLIDSIPNMGAERIDEFAEPFLRKLRDAHPATPIVLVEDRTYPAAWITPQAREQNVSRRRSFKQVYARLLERYGDDSKFHYIEGDGLFGVDNDGTNDGSHANDLGASRIVDRLEPVLRRLLGLCGT